MLLFPAQLDNDLNKLNCALGACRFRIMVKISLEEEVAADIKHGWSSLPRILCRVAALYAGIWLAERILNDSSRKLYIGVPHLVS